MGSMPSVLLPPTLCSGGKLGGVFPVSEDFLSPPAHPYPVTGSQDSGGRETGISTNRCLD